ncbi:DNA_helicase [Hexamita inflata]|uniref:Putative n=1 Tax=Hexamita inflata TaxID=28002 RepID=A0AA86NE90_9EUKA|nr:DNA helicase [Hexamita inflata]
MQSKPEYFESFNDYTQKQLAINEKLAQNYKKFTNNYPNIEAYQQQYSKALTIENQIQIFSHKRKQNISKNITIIEDVNPEIQLEYQVESTSNIKSYIQLNQKLYGPVISEQKGKLLFWFDKILATVDIIVQDNEILLVDHQFIQNYKGEHIKSQIVKQFNSETRIFQEVISIHTKVKEKVQVYLIITEDSIPFKRMQETLKNCSDKHQIISQIIKGTVSDQIDKTNVFIKQSTLNKSQNDAGLIALQRNVSLIQGCPGGGKTTTSAHIVKQAMKKYKKILVCAGTNVAADNLCMSLKKIGVLATRVCSVSREQNYEAGKKYSPKVHPEIADREIHSQCLQKLQKFFDKLKSRFEDYKLSHPDDKQAQKFFDWESGFNKTHYEIFKSYFSQPPKVNFICSYPSKKENKNEAFDLYRCEYSLVFENSQVIVSTCSTSGDRRFQSNNTLTKFDFCLLDESSQCIEPEQLIPIVHGCTKLVLVGDQKQLGPVISSQNLFKAGFGLSLFQRLVNCNFPITALNVQYRMHPALIEYPNKRYYDGIISSGISDAQRILKLRTGKVQMVTDDFPSVMINVKGQEEHNDSLSYCNKKECEETINTVNKLLRTYEINEKDIGIITPYTGQKQLIRHKLQKLNLNQVEISSVDEFQGREKKIVILSFVRTIKSGFTDDVKRLNVSLTRAQYQLYILCNVSCLNKNKELKELVKFYDEKKAVINTQ